MNTRLIYCLIIIAVTSFPSSALFSEEKFPEMQTDRPDSTEGTNTVPVGTLQVESGYTFTESRNVEEHSLGEVLIRLGVLDRLELRLGVNSYLWTSSSEEDTHGKDDLAAQVKVNLTRSPETFTFWHPDVSIILGADFPGGSRVYREEKVRPGGILALAWPVSEWLDIGANLGYTYASKDDEYYSEFFESLALGFGITDALGMYIEYFAFQPEGKDSYDVHYIDGGFTVGVPPDLQLDARAGILLDAHRDEYFLGAGLTFRFNNLY